MPTRRTPATATTPSQPPTSALPPAAPTRGHGYVPGTPRWARVAAHAVPFVVLPSSIWRVLLAAGLSGVQHPWDPGSRFRLTDWVYVLCLSMVSEGFAVLTLGLVKPWGEVVPRWVPVLGGRRVAVKAAVVPALAGAAVLVAISVYFLVNRLFLHLHFAPGVGTNGGPDAHLVVSGWSKVLLIACYVPLLLWPVLVVACTVAYQRRRSASGR